MIAALLGFFFILGTVFFFKCPPVLLVLLSGAALWGAWCHPRFRLSYNPFLYWGILVIVLSLHTIFFSVDFSLSLGSMSRFLGTLLLIAWLSAFLSSQEDNPPPFPLDTSVFFWLYCVSIAGILIQFWGKGFLTRLLSDTLNGLGGTPLIIPQTLKTHLALLMVAFFVFLGMNRARSFSLYVMGLGALGVAVILKFHAAILAFTCAMIVFVGAQIAPRMTWVISTVSMVSSFLFLPKILSLLWRVSFLHFGISSIFNTFGQRLTHWHDLLPCIEKNFWFGSGLGSSRLICPTKTFKLPLQFAHNMIFELWLEVGFAGIVLISGAFGWLLWRIKRIQDSHAFATTLSFIVFVFFINQASYSNLHIWWLSAYSLGGFSLYWLFGVRSVEDPSRGRASSNTRIGTLSRIG